MQSLFTYLPILCWWHCYGCYCRMWLVTATFVFQIKIMSHSAPKCRGQCVRVPLSGVCHSPLLHEATVRLCPPHIQPFGSVLLAILWLVFVSACMDSLCSIRVTTERWSFAQPYHQTVIEERYTNDSPSQGADTLTTRRWPIIIYIRGSMSESVLM